MTESVVSEISSHLLFRFRFPIQRIENDSRQPSELSDAFQVPWIATHNPGKKSAMPFAELRAAWSQNGIYFWLGVPQKTQSLWCKKTMPLESDGLRLWIDTRDTHNVHRATKFCHWFLLLPSGGGAGQDEPIATMLKINRAREHSPTINQSKIGLRAEITSTGYSMACFIPANSLSGWDAAEHRTLGFNYSVSDRELGNQHLSVGYEFPVAEDPSLWQTAHLAL